MYTSKMSKTNKHSNIKMRQVEAIGTSNCRPLKVSCPHVYKTETVYHISDHDNDHEM